MSSNKCGLRRDIILLNKDKEGDTVKVTISFVPQKRMFNSRGLDSQPVQSIYLLGEILKKNDYDVTIIDPFFLEDLDITDSTEVEKRLLANTEVLLLSINTFNWGNTRMLIESAKKAQPDIPIVVGGIHATFFDRYIMNNSPVDVVIRGEGEIRNALVLEKIFKRDWAGLKDIKGIAFRDDKGNIIRTADAIPLTLEEYNAFNADSPFRCLPKGVYNGIPCETSRGCMYNCIFCGIDGHHSWRSLTVEKTIHKIEQSIGYIHNLTDNGFLTITDDCFTSNKERMIAVLDYLNHRPDNFQLVLEGRLNELQSPEVVAAINPDRVRRFLVGVECGYNEGLKKVRKGYTVDSLERCLSNVKASGLNKMIYCSFIIALPWETEKECIQTIRFAAKIMEKYEVQSNISFWSIIPSELWTTRAEYGIQLDDTFFDNPLWFFHNENQMDDFRRIHPNLSEKGLIKVEKVLAMYRERGYKLTDN